MALDGQVASVFGYSFILSDIHWQPAVWVEHFHRHPRPDRGAPQGSQARQALRHLPSGDEHANRVWLTAALLALNLTAGAATCAGAGASGRPRRRAAAPNGQDAAPHPLQRPARIIRSARRIILRLPEGFRHADVFQATLDAVYALPPP